MQEILDKPIFGMYDKTIKALKKQPNVKKPVPKLTKPTSPKVTVTPKTPKPV